MIMLTIIIIITIITNNNKYNNNNNNNNDNYNENLSGFKIMYILFIYLFIYFMELLCVSPLLFLIPSSAANY